MFNLSALPLTLISHTQEVSQKFGGTTKKNSLDTKLTFDILLGVVMQKVMVLNKRRMTQKLLHQTAAFIAHCKFQVWLTGCLDKLAIMKIHTYMPQWQKFPFSHFAALIHFLSTLPLPVFKEICSKSPGNVPLFYHLLSPKAIKHLNCLFARFTLEQKILLMTSPDVQENSLLHAACSTNDFDLVAFILSQIPEHMLLECLNKKNKSHYTPFLNSYMCDNENAFRALLQFGQKKGLLELMLEQIDDEDKANALQKACFLGNTSWIKLMLEFVAPEKRVGVLTPKANILPPPFELAVQMRRFETIKELLNICPQILYEASPNGNNILCWACLSGIEEIFQMIHAHLLLRGDDLKSCWRRLLISTDSGISMFNSLGQCHAQEEPSQKTPKSILVLLEIKKVIPFEEMRKAVLESSIIISAIQFGNLILAQHLIKEYPELMTFQKESYGICHILAMPFPTRPPCEEERILFFKKFRSQLNSHLNEIGQDNTPLSLANEHGLKKLATCFIEEGASEEALKSIKCPRKIAAVWSIGGQFKSGSYLGSLEGAPTVLPFLLSTLESLNAFVTDYPQLSDVFDELIAGLSVYALPVEEHQKAMVARAQRGALWLKPVQFAQNKVNHAIMIAGMKEWVCLFNRNKNNIYASEEDLKADKPSLTIPPGISFFKISNNFNPKSIVSILDGTCSYFDLFLKFTREFDLMPIHLVDLSPQKTGNCVAVSAKGAVLGGVILSRLAKSFVSTSKDSIEKAALAVRPYYKAFTRYDRSKKLETLKPFAEPFVVAAIESKALLKYIRKLLNNEFRELLPLIKTELPFVCFVSKDWDKLTEEQCDFYTDVSKTDQRQAFIKQLIDLNHSQLNKRLTDYIACHNLKSLL